MLYYSISAVWEQFHLIHSKDSESPYSTGHVKCVRDERTVKFFSLSPILIR